MRSTYYELTVTPSAHLERFLDFVQNIYEEAIEVGETALILRSERALDEIVWGVESFAEALSEATGERVTVDTQLEERKNIDWIARYREAIRPVEVGDFYVYPSWESPKEGKRNIMIDPALAFGSGHHETTASCLDAIGRYVKAQMRVLDVGCGSGILGIAATMLGAGVDACDTDPLAVENAQKNFELNGCRAEHIWEGSVMAASDTYDVVVANIVADVLRMMAGDLKKCVKEGGHLILSGILDSKEAQIEEAFGDWKLLEPIKKSEWRTKIYCHSTEPHIAL